MREGDGREEEAASRMTCLRMINVKASSVNEIPGLHFPVHSLLPST